MEEERTEGIKKMLTGFVRKIMEQRRRKQTEERRAQKVSAR